MTNRTKVYPRRWDDLDWMMEDDEWDDKGWRIKQKLTPEEGMIWLGWWMGWWMMTNRTKVYPWRCDDKWDDGGWRTGHKFTPEEEQQTGADNAEDQFPASKKLFVIIITIPYYWYHRYNLRSPLIILMGSVYCWKEKGKIMMYDNLWLRAALLSVQNCIDQILFWSAQSAFCTFCPQWTAIGSI